MGVAALALLIPTFADVLRGLQERESLARTLTGSRWQLLADFALGRVEIGYPELAWVGLSMLGFVLLVMHRRPAIPVVAAVLVGLALVAWSPADGVLTFLTQPWYGSAYRIAYLLAIPATVAVGVAAAWLFGLWRDAGADRRLPLMGFVWVVAVLCVASVGLVAVRAGRQVVANVDNGTALANGSGEAFDFLSEQASGSVVAGEYCDQSTWMYALDGVAPLLGVLTPDPEGNREQDRRLSALRALSAGEENPHSLAAVRELGIRFVYFGEGSQCPDGERLMSIDGLRTSPWLDDVFDSGGAHVFELRRSSG